MKELNREHRATSTSTATTRRRSTSTSSTTRASAKTGTSAVQRDADRARARPGGNEPRQQHQHLRQPALQQEVERVQRRRGLRDRAGAVGQGRLRVPADRPQLPGFLDQLRRRDQGDRQHVARSPTTRRWSRPSAGASSYAYSQRRVDYNPNAWLALVPMANYVPAGGATTSVYGVPDRRPDSAATAPTRRTTPLQPGNLGIFFPNNSALPQALYGSRNDIHEIPGMERFNQADRDRNKVRGSINWDATSELVAQRQRRIHRRRLRQLGVRPAERQEPDGQRRGQLDRQRELHGELVLHLRGAAGAERRASRTAPGRSPTRANVGGVAGNTVVSGGCFSTVAGEEHERQDRPVPQLGHRHEGQGEHDRRELRLEEPRVRQAGAHGQRALQRRAHGHRRHRRHVCEQPVRGGRPAGGESGGDLHPGGATCRR